MRARIEEGEQESEGDSSPSKVVIVTEDPDNPNLHNPLSFVIATLKNENRRLKAEIIALRRIIDFGISGGVSPDSDPSDPEVDRGESSSITNLYCIEIEEETAKKFEEVVHARAATLVDDLLAQAKRLQNGTAAVSTRRLGGCVITRWRIIVVVGAAIIFAGICAVLLLGKGGDDKDNYYS